MRDKLGRLSRRERLVFGATLAVAALFLADRLIVSGLREKWGALDDEIAAKEVMLRRDLLSLARKDLIVREYNLYVASSAGSGGGQDEMTGLLRELETYARAGGVKIRDIKPQEGPRTSPAVLLIAESSWEAFARFLHDVQKSPRLLQIEKATLHAKGQGSALVTGQLLIRKIAPEKEGR